MGLGDVRLSQNPDRFLATLGSLIRSHVSAALGCNRHDVRATMHKRPGRDGGFWLGVRCAVPGFGDPVQHESRVPAEVLMSTDSRAAEESLRSAALEAAALVVDEMRKRAPQPAVSPRFGPADTRPAVVPTDIAAVLGMPEPYKAGRDVASFSMQKDIASHRLEVVMEVVDGPTFDDWAAAVGRAQASGGAMAPGVLMRSVSMEQEAQAVYTEGGIAPRHVPGRRRLDIVLAIDERAIVDRDEMRRGRRGPSDDVHQVDSMADMEPWLEPEAPGIRCPKCGRTARLERGDVGRPGAVYVCNADGAGGCGCLTVDCAGCGDVYTVRDALGRGDAMDAAPVCPECRHTAEW
jgi:hypothetical protein